MPKVFPVELGSVLDNLRKRILRMLIGVSGKGTERLEFPNRVQPASYRRAMLRAPFLDCKCELGRPQEQRRGDRGEQRIQPGIQPLNEKNQSMDLFRWRTTSGFESGLQFPQLFCFPFFFLESRQQ